MVRVSVGRIGCIGSVGCDKVKRCHWQSRLEPTIDNKVIISLDIAGF